MPDVRLTPKRPEYYVQTGSMFENPHGVPHDEIVQMILENPAEVSAQVIFGKYVESSGLVFTGQLIQNMIDRSIGRVIGDSWIDRDAQAEAAHYFTTYGPHAFFNRFASGVDFARQTDYTVISTLDTRYTPARLVYYKRLNRVPWETIYTEVGKTRAMWGSLILCDSTGMGGDVVMDALESRAYCPIHKRTVMMDSICLDDHQQPLGCDRANYLPLSCCEGYSFQTGSKKQLIENLRGAMSLGYRANDPDHAYGALRVPPIVQLEEEMSFYIWEDKKLSTDAVMSLALAAWAGLHDQVAEAIVGSPYGR